MARVLYDQRWALAGLALLLVIVFLPVIGDLIDSWWNNENYSHGFLVPLIAGYMVWRKRHELAKTEVKPSGAGLVMTLAGMIMFVVGNAGAEYFTVGISLIVTMAGLTLYLGGREIMGKIWFPFFLLVFMVPIPAVVYFSATFPMQLLASKVSAALMEILGMSVVREGNIIHLPGHSLEVAEACSGLRSLISLLAMGAIYGYVAQERFRAKLALFLCTIPIAIAGNVIRVFVASILTYMFDVDTTVEPLHTIMGLVMFIFSFIVLAILSAIVRRIFR